jgi:hypothetical protein
MVTDLLKVDWTPINPRLISLPEDGVEGLLHRQVNQGAEMDHPDDIFQLLLGILNQGCLLQIHGSEGKRGSKTLNVRLSAEDINRKGNVEDAFSAEDVPANTLDDEGQDFLLLVHFLLIDVVQASSGTNRPLSLVKVMTSIMRKQSRWSFLKWRKCVSDLDVLLRNYHCFIL